MTEFYCGVVCVVVLVFYPWKPRKILVLLRVKAKPSLFLIRGKFLHRPLGATLTDLLSKLVCSETKGEEESEMKRNDLNCQ